MGPRPMRTLSALELAGFGGQSALTMSNVILKDLGTAVNLSTFQQVKLSRLQMLKMLAEIRRKLTPPSR